MNSTENLQKFRGKNIYIEYFLDKTYRIAGDPQYHRICKINGRLVFDSKLNIKEISSADFDLLRKYGYNKGSYNKKVNFYGYNDFTFMFTVY